MGAPGFWDDQEHAASVSAAHARAQRRLETFRGLEADVGDLGELAEMATEDAELADELDSQLASVESRLAALEEARLFSGTYDGGDAVVTVRSGAGGTDSQDWAEMLLRMYLRWAERRGFEVEMKEASEGEEAGIKSATFLAKGENAYGLFAAERGVHRLVRISPFDAQSRRHTAFAQVDVAPLVDDAVDVDIDEEDIRVDTYRASGAGGQHVNKTDSAVRLTHVPTGIVVQCQNERSQTQNKATAMRMLRARLLEEEERKRAAELAAERGEQKAAEWGSQIRSYTLHPTTQGQGPSDRVRGRRRRPGARRRPRRVRARVPQPGGRIGLRMASTVAVGISDRPETAAAFDDAAAAAAAGLDAECDLALVFAAAPHLSEADELLGAVHERLAPAALIGCGAGGVVGGGRELEGGPGAVVWGLSAPGARITTHHLEAPTGAEGASVEGLPDPDSLGEAALLLADPYTFSAEALLRALNDERPGMPVLGGLASAAAAGSAPLFKDREVIAGGAVAAGLAGVPVLPCVSQGATPIGPEMTITAAHGNVIEQLASKPAIDRLRDAIAELEPREQLLAAQGLMLGIVIDENQPEYERGDFLVRPILGADPERAELAIGERVRVGQTVRMHVRDGATADEDLRAALRMQTGALAGQPPAGALLFTCNGRGSHMFDVPDHDAGALEDAFAAPTAGFFCAGEIGPVGGRNFLHGFTATIALFPK